MISIDKVFDATLVLKKVAKVTDLIYAPAFSQQAQVYLKTENLQTTGSFKIRGSYYKIHQLTPEEKKHGVVTCSSGNHAQGVALASQENGIHATIFVPSCTPQMKIQAIRSFNPELIIVDGVFDDALVKAEEFAAQTGAIYIPPFDDYNIIAGQGTIGFEILKQLPEVEAIVVPVGGGGLISGIAFAVKTLRPSCKIYGVQSLGAASMYTALARAQRAPLRSIKTIADGIAVKTPGVITYEMCQKYVDDMFVVKDEQVEQAIKQLVSLQKLVVEGAGAVALTAVMNNILPVEGKKTVCVLSGGNVDTSNLANFLTHYL